MMNQLFIERLKRRHKHVKWAGVKIPKDLLLQINKKEAGEVLKLSADESLKEVKEIKELMGLLDKLVYEHKIAPKKFRIKLW